MSITGCTTLSKGLLCDRMPLIAYKGGVMLIVFLIVNTVLLITVVLLLIFKRGGNSKIETITEILRIMRDDLNGSRKESSENTRALQESVRQTLKDQSEYSAKSIEAISGMQRDKLDFFAKEVKTLSENTDKRLESLRMLIEDKLEKIRKDNNEKLESMRVTVDEKLHKTLETRLGESFKSVSDLLSNVFNRLGEMSELAKGVGDLKNVLNNVKNRGTFGEYQLQNILEDLMSPNQYETNVETVKNSGKRVEFAIKLPGTGNDTVWLPIDSKFPMECYRTLLEAQESGEKDALQKARTDMAKVVEKSAKDISEKYIRVPETTDFALMFLPTEGLYAEVVRDTELFEKLRKTHRVSVVGPNTFSAFLNSLQMGFKTLAIQKRSSEVWRILGEVKTEFGKFGDVLEKTKIKLEQATKEIENAGVRTRKIEKSLRDVEESPIGNQNQIEETLKITNGE